MKKIIPLVLATIASTYISPVSATEDNSWYIGSYYTAQKISQPSTGRDFSTAGLILGYQYNNYFSLETRFSKGVSGNTFNYGFRDFPDNNFDTDIDYQTSLIIKASYPIFEKANIYATTGYSKTKIEQDILDPDVSSGMLVGVNVSNYSFTENGFTYGVGVNYTATKNINLFVDYHILPESKSHLVGSESWDSISIGFNYLF